MYNPDYSHLLDQSDPSLDYNKIRLAFERAFTINPKDTNVLLALGVLQFI